MPRKQRFKPSRKPKLPQPAEVIETTEPQRSSSPTQPEDIESGQQARSQPDTSSVIEGSGGNLGGA